MNWLADETTKLYEDLFDPNVEASLGNPVVFSDGDGRPLCYLKDRVWQTPTGERFYWEPDHPELEGLYDEAKSLLLHVLYHPQLYDLATSTIRNYQFGLKVLAAATLDCGYGTLGVFFSTPRAADRIIDRILELPGKTAFIHIGAGLFNSLVKIDEETLGFGINRGRTYRRLRSLLSELNKASFQHPVIPWDIYKHLVKEINALVDHYLDLLDHPAWCDALNMFYVRTEGKSHHLKKVAVENLLKSSYPEFPIEKRRTRWLVYELGSIQELARIGVLMFTGCRMSELVTILPKRPKHKGNGIYVLEGRSDKLGHNNVSWVTNENGARAVRLALLVRKTIGTALEIDTSTSMPHLFPSLGDFPRHIGKKRSKYWLHSRKRQRGRTRLVGVLNRLGVETPNITPIAHKFLTELSRDCRMNLNEFSIGSVFPLTPHQLRRSLAYYAMRSGNVELGALKRQFKHLAIVMTEYYTSGVLGLGSRQKHTMAELVAKERLSEIDERLRSHLSDFESLDGTMGYSIRNNIKAAPAEDRVNVIESSRQSILRRADNGEVSYTQTPLGACMSNDPCLTRHRNEISACLRCKSAVIERPKAERAFEALRDSRHPFLAAQAEHFSRFLLKGK